MQRMSFATIAVCLLASFFFKRPPPLSSREVRPPMDNLTPGLARPPIFPYVFRCNLADIPLVISGTRYSGMVFTLGSVLVYDFLTHIIRIPLDGGDPEYRAQLRLPRRVLFGNTQANKWQCSLVGSIIRRHSESAH